MTEADSRLQVDGIRESASAFKDRGRILTVIDFIIDGSLVGKI